MSEPINPREFRRQLDDVLRQRNPTALRDFLVAAGQWDEDNTPADIDRAMWMMIAGSAALTDLHDEARRWLVDHGFTQEAQAILGRAGGAGSRQLPRGSASQRTGAGERAGSRQRSPQRSHGPSPSNAARGSEGNRHDGNRPTRHPKPRPSDGQERKP